MLERLRRHMASGRSTEGAYLIYLETLIERPWRACEGDGVFKLHQPLQGSVRKLVRHGNIAHVIYMLFISWAKSDFPMVFVSKWERILKASFSPPFRAVTKKTALSCAVISHCTCAEVPAAFTM